MPIVIVEAERPLKNRQALAAVTQAVADAIDCPRASVWVRYEHVPPRQYCEGDGSSPYTPAIVVVRLLRGRPKKALQKMMDGVATALARALKMDKRSVWCTVLELDPDLTSQGGVPYSVLQRVK